MNIRGYRKKKKKISLRKTKVEELMSCVMKFLRKTVSLIMIWQESGNIHIKKNALFRLMISIRPAVIMSILQWFYDWLSGNHFWLPNIKSQYVRSMQVYMI